MIAALTASWRRLLPRVPRPTTTLVVALTALLALAGTTAISADAATHHRHHHRRHHRKHHAVRHSFKADGCRNANRPATSSSTEQMREAVTCLINKQREARGLPALRTSHRLNSSAQNWTDTMVATDSFTHGSDPGARVSAVGFNWSTMGENIASGFRTPMDVVKGWMASQGHCFNILDPDYSYVGTGVNRSAVRGAASGPATWTQDFALPMGARAPSRNWHAADACPYG